VKFILTIICLSFLFNFQTFSQSNIPLKGDLKGYVYDINTGEPIIFTNVILKGTSFGTQTDINGFFSIKQIPVGNYQITSTYVGYDSAKVEIVIKHNEVVNQKLYIGKKARLLKLTTVTGKKQEKLNQVQIGETKVTAQQIKQLPSIGGEPDLAQYLQVVPGVVSTGDQGGQLYIRGGSPVQNKVILDGMTIYNPFHSIGLFSVFETEAIKNADIKTAGFNVDYGGATSAIIDISTRDGNKKKLSGKVSTNTFMSKVLLEGPLKKLKDNGGGSSSFLITAKANYLDRSSKIFYKYLDTTGIGLPYSFNDIYAKLNFSSGSGSKLNIFGFNFTDQANYELKSLYKWGAYGGGLNFSVSPSNSTSIINGLLSGSRYTLALKEATDDKPRNTSISGVNLQLNVTNSLLNDATLNYGMELVAFATKYLFYNNLGFKVGEGEDQNTSEIAFFAKYRRTFNNKFVFEPGIRVPYYASLNSFNYIEPRLGIKYNVTSNFRFKAAAGRYSQNLISTKSDRDIVNLFTGFLSGPEVKLKNTEGDYSKSKLQKSLHAVAGIEYDLFKGFEINFETYIKKFTQLININRNKVKFDDPNYQIEQGKAYGFDFLAKYEYKSLYVWFVYSLGFVNRYNGTKDNNGYKVYYSPPFDRRHNVNALVTYAFGKNDSWDVSMRWNFGSGFPFTLTQGFFENIDFTQQGIHTNYLTQNGTLGILYDSTINAGRLPYYHRLDFAIKKKIYFSKRSQMEISFSIINVYNRANIFYFDRIRYTRVNQLPFLPALGLNYTF
jgi:hypothetical protein